MYGAAPECLSVWKRANLHLERLYVYIRSGWYRFLLRILISDDEIYVRNYFSLNQEKTQAKKKYIDWRKQN